MIENSGLESPSSDHARGKDMQKPKAKPKVSTTLTIPCSEKKILKNTLKSTASNSEH